MNAIYYYPLLSALLLTCMAPNWCSTPQETLDQLAHLHALYQEKTTDHLSSDEIEDIIELLEKAHELAHTSSYQDHVDLTRMISDITDWLMDMSDTLEPELATAVRSCCAQKCFKCLIVDTLIVRNKAYLPNTGTSSSSGSCAPCSSQDLPNTLALRDTTGSFALNNLTADGNITLTKSVAQSPSGIIYMEGVPALWIYKTLAADDYSVLIGKAGNLTGAHYSSDVAIGDDALSSALYHASNNTAIGSGAMQSATAANANVAIGSATLVDLTTGSSNTAVGSGTLYLATGSQNTAIGKDALSELRAGDNNTAVGFRAGLVLNSGSQNTILGTSAYATFTFPGATGSNNIIIGYGAAPLYTTSESNNIIIDASGTGALGVAGESGVCRISNINGVNVTGSPVIVSTSNQLGITVSSKRFKTDITDITSRAPEIVNQLRPVQFRYLTKDGGAQETISHGLIAEEVAEVDDTLVVYGEDGLPLTVKYHEMDAYYIAALQYVMKENSELRRALEQQQQDIAYLRSIIG